MIYKKLSQLQKTFAIGLTVVAAYSSLPLPSLATPVQAQSALLTFSTATPAVATESSLLLPFGFKLATLEGLKLTSDKAFKIQNPKSKIQNGIRLQLAQTPGQIASRSAASPFQTTPLLIDRGAPAPGQRVGGGSRGICPKASQFLTALVPIIPATPTNSVLGLTFADHPTLWFYFPYSLTPERTVEFTLKDDKDNIIYQTLLSESGTMPGVVGFKLPETVPSLEINKRYKWYLTFFCDPNERSDFRVVEGWVERVTLAPSLQQELEQATPQQKVLLYTQAGVWHEAVTALAELRRQKPNDATLKQEWDQLMQLIDLEAIAKEPITSMLTPKK